MECDLKTTHALSVIERKKVRDTQMEAFLFISQLANQNSAISITKALIILFMAALVSVILSQFYWKKNRSVRNLPLPPGPTPWPLVGSLFALLRHWPAHQWIHRVMKELNTEIAYLRLGNTDMIVVTSQELALECLKNHDSNFGTRPDTVTGKIVTYGYLSTGVTPTGDQWNKIRKVLVSHVLNSKMLHQTSRHRNMESDALVRHIFKLTTAQPNGGAVINLRSVTLHYCGNLIRRMLLSTKYYNDGREDEGPTFEEEEHIQALLTILKYIHTFSISDFIPCLKWFDLDGQQKAVKQALKVVRRHDDPIIYERIQQWKDDKNKEVNDILDIFITLKDDNGKPLMSIKEIQANIQELQMASIDNPSFAAEWALLELMNRPEIHKKAIEELDRVVGKDRLVQESDIAQLKYLTAIIRECIRLHPFFPFNVHHASTSDTTVAGYFIPKGSRILVSRMEVGRNSRMWENPMEFNPDRHLDDATIELGLQEPSQRFISFSRGRRGCIGITLGTTITMMLFARLLQGFSWSLLPGTTKIDFPNQPYENHLPNPLQLVAQPRLAHNLYPNEN